MSRLSLFVPVTGGGHDEISLSTAAVVAKPFKAHLGVVHASPSPMEMVPMVGEGMTAGVLEQLNRAAQAEVERRRSAAHNAFREAVDRFKIPLKDSPPPPDGPSASFRNIDGRMADQMTRLARLCDLTVMARPHESADDTLYLELVETLTTTSGRPVLLAPQEPDVVGKRIAIAWRGSTDAAHAVVAAAPFLDTSESVVVYSVNTRKTTGTGAQDLAESLRWRGVNAEARVLDAGGDPVGATLLSAAADDDADMLVMGAYGHSRMREMLLGGVTRYMVAHAGIPVLLAH